jgi:hypothetical protein
MLRFNHFNHSAVEVFCVSEESRLIKVQMTRHCLDKSNVKKLLNRNKRSILDYRLTRGDRAIVLFEDDSLVMIDTLCGTELHNYTIKDMVHKNIFTFAGD